MAQLFALAETATKVSVELAHQIATQALERKMSGKQRQLLEEIVAWAASAKEPVCVPTETEPQATEEQPRPVSFPFRFASD